MSAVASINISGSITSAAGGSNVFGPFNISSNAANPAITEIVLASGDNTITVPATPATSGCVIVLNSANTVVTTFKYAGGDTGFPIGKTTKQVLNWDPTAAPATFILNAASAQTGLNTEIRFF